jgi:hypothetical protein
MTSMVMILMTAWLWLGLVPQLVLGDRRLSSWHLLGEWVAGPIGLTVALAHRHSSVTAP